VIPGAPGVVGFDRWCFSGDLAAHPCSFLTRTVLLFKSANEFVAQFPESIQIVLVNEVFKLSVAMVEIGESLRP
jgi:hypothetical protein